MFLSLETLTSPIRSCVPFFVELIDLVISNDLPDMAFGLISFFWCYCLFYNGLPSLGNSDHVVFSVSIDFLWNSQWDTLFHSITYNYLGAGWDVFVIIWDVPCKERLCASAAASEFSQWFLCWNWCIYPLSKVSGQASLISVVFCCKITYANKAKLSITSQNLDSGNFWQIANGVRSRGKYAIPPAFNTAGSVVFCI